MRLISSSIADSLFYFANLVLETYFSSSLIRWIGFRDSKKALLEAIELHDKGDMVSDLVTHMVNSIPKISRQRKYCDFLVGEINSLAPAVPEWQPSLDVVVSIRDEIDRERAMVPIPSPPAPTGRYRFLRIADQTLSRPTIPPSLFGLSIRNDERGE